MNDGLRCTDYLNARKQIAYLIQYYIPTHKIVVEKPYNNDGQKECKVYVFLNDEDKKLGEHEYKGTLGFWGSYIGQIVKDGHPAASYLFKWRG